MRAQIFDILPLFLSQSAASYFSRVNFLSALTFTLAWAFRSLKIKDSSPHSWFKGTWLSLRRIIFFYTLLHIKYFLFSFLWFNLLPINQNINFLLQISRIVHVFLIDRYFRCSIRHIFKDRRKLLLISINLIEFNTKKISILHLSYVWGLFRWVLFWCYVLMKLLLDYLQSILLLKLFKRVMPITIGTLITSAFLLG